MSATGWRRLCLVLGVISCVQTWRACHRPRPAPAVVDAGSPEARPTASRPSSSWDDRETTAPRTAPAARAPGLQIYGFGIPPWALAMAPQPGENLRAYRDRMLPLAQAAVAPQRARVARSRDDFAAAAGLDTHQREGLDAAAQETATAIQDRIFTAVLGGELAPATFKPMAGVTVARDVLELVDRANRRFVGSLREDQRARLAHHPFDFADYLVFSTPWEDAISGL